jgi:hypothetical protein
MPLEPTDVTCTENRPQGRFTDFGTFGTETTQHRPDRAWTLLALLRLFTSTGRNPDLLLPSSATLKT